MSIAIILTGVLIVSLGSVLTLGAERRRGSAGWESDEAVRFVKGVGIGSVVGGALLTLAGLLWWIFA